MPQGKVTHSIIHLGCKSEFCAIGRVSRPVNRVSFRFSCPACFGGLARHLSLGIFYTTGCWLTLQIKIQAAQQITLPVLFSQGQELVFEARQGLGISGQGFYVGQDASGLGG